MGRAQQATSMPAGPMRGCLAAVAEDLEGTRTDLRAGDLRTPQRRGSSRPWATARLYIFRLYGEVPRRTPGRQGVLPECLPGVPLRI